MTTLPRQSIEKFAIVDLAEALTILCGDETIADLMNATLSAEADERLSDHHARLADLLFDQLTELRPDCVDIAQGNELSQDEHNSQCDRIFNLRRIVK